MAKKENNMKKKENTIILNEDAKEQILDIFSDVVNDNNSYSNGFGIDEDDVIEEVQRSDLENTKDYAIKVVGHPELYLDEDDVCYGDVYQILFKNIPTDLYIMCEWTRTGTNETGYGYIYDEPYIVKKTIITVKKINWLAI